MKSNVIMFIIRSENASNKIQYESNVNYVKIFLVQDASSQIQGSSKFFEEDRTNL